MSQTDQSSLLDEVVTWSAEQCQSELTETLPKLICQYSNGASNEKKINILKILVANFLPHLSLDVLEEKLLSRILPQTRLLFDKILNDVGKKLTADVSGTAELQNALLQCLQFLVTMMETLCSCVHQVTSMCKNYGTVTMETIQSLPSTALYVVKGSFSHCKDSNELYGDHFSSVSEPLSTLFKKAYGLQKSLMALLDTVNMSAQDGDDVISKMVEVCAGFHELCCIISSMDSTLMVSTWRFLVKLASKHKDVLKDSLEISSLIKSLCSDIESNYQHCLQIAPLQPGMTSSQGDEKAFAKTLKICNLCLKMLMHLLKEFDGFLGDCAGSLYHLVIVLQSLAPPSVYAPPISNTAQEELNKSLLVCIEPFLLQLVTNKSFCETVLASEQDLTKSQWFGQLLTLIHLTKIIPSTTAEFQACWLDPSVFPEDLPQESIFQAVFSTLSKCHVELNTPVSLPGIMCNGQSQRSISLQEYVSTYLCSFVAVVSAKHFGVVERTLLNNVLNRNISVALTAMDVWCFLARYGTPELCFTHVRLLISLMGTLPANNSPAYVHLCMLLRRLIPLMTAEDQVTLISQYPVESNLQLWIHLPLLAFPEDSRTSLAEQIVKTGLERCQTWLCMESKTRSSLDQLTINFSALSSLYRQYKLSQPPISSQLQTSIEKMVCQLYQLLPLDKITSHDIVPTLISLSGALLQNLEPGDLNMILSEILKLIKYEKISIHVRMATTEFLRHLSRKQIPPCTQQSQLLRQISDLFSKVLADKHWVVQQLALQAFSSFAEETSHESIVPECLKDEAVQRKAVNFLSKEPQSYNSGKSEVDYLEEQLQLLCDFAKQQEELKYTEPIEQSKNQANLAESASITQEPATKRAKYDDTALREALNQAKSGLHRIQELKNGNNQETKPPWLKDELKMIKDQVVNLLSDL